MPEARRRIQDYLNRPSSFVELKEGKVTCFINTRYITLVTVYDRMQGSP